MEKVDKILPEITAIQAKELLDSENSPFLLDVRDHNEVALCKIDGSEHIPMDQVMEKLEILPKNEKLVVYCNYGGRSQIITQALVNQGFMAINMQDGINAWALAVHPQVACY